MKWTEAAKAAAQHAQQQYNDDVVEARIKRAEEISEQNGYGMVDTDVWFSALLDVRLLGPDRGGRRRNATLCPPLAVLSAKPTSNRQR